MFVVNRRGLLRGAIAFAFPAAVFGGWLPGQSYRPEPAGTPPVKVGAGWIIGGAFAGWGVGIAIGMGLMLLIAPRRPADWAVPLFFFSPPIACLVLGGIAGCRVGRRRSVTKAAG